MDTFHRLAGVSDDTADAHPEAPQPAFAFPPPPPIPEDDDITNRPSSRRSSRASIPLNRQPSQKSLKRTTTPKRGAEGTSNGGAAATTPVRPNQTSNSNPREANNTTSDADARGNNEGEVEGTENGTEDFAWGPSHPCYPHPNPHCSRDSPLYTSTRVIRVRRDWLSAGDLYPQFANLYPEILDPLVTDTEFRVLISTINERLRTALDPFGGSRAYFDAFMGVVTGFLWESLGFAESKKGFRALEGWLRGWNEEMRKQGREVKVVMVRRTGFMSLDFVVPDPGIGDVVEEGTEGEGEDDGLGRREGDAAAVGSGGIGPAL